MEQNKKLSLKEVLKRSLRAYGILHRYSPFLLPAIAASGIMQGIAPYVGIFFSARIISEIAGDRRADVLQYWVVWALISVALLALLSAAAKRWSQYHQDTWWHSENRVYAEKLLSMDFHAVDDPHVHDLFSQLGQNRNWGAWGLYRPIWVFDGLVGACVSIISATVLVVPLFRSKVPMGMGALDMLNNPLFVVAVWAVIFGVALLAPVVGNRAQLYWSNYADEAKWGNRLFAFFGFMGYDRPRALDIRMYRQFERNDWLRRQNAFGVKSSIARLARGKMGAIGAAAGAISQIVTGMAYLFVGLKAWAGAFGVGEVTQYVAAIVALSAGVGELIGNIGSLHANATFLGTTFEFLDIPTNMYAGSLTIEKRSDRRYEIEFKDVSFQYPGSDACALSHVSLKFDVGQRLAVVGMNGSGKTTFIKLLCRLYDPTEGEILLNGVDIRKYDYHEYMSIFSVVFQDFKLLAFALGENVAVGMRFDHDRAEACLREAGFDPAAHNMTLETCLYKDFDEAGVTISGGEAQKIALARALYKDAAFLILDEPTAALDPVAEFEVYSKMNEIAGGKTAVFISHRLSSCRFCHDIAVFHEGSVIQRGSHDALVADDSGKYHELWHAQAQYYTT